MLQNRIDVLHGRAAAFGDALAPLAIDHVVIAALLVGHGVDDGLDARELALVDLRIFGKILQRPHFRQHIHDFLERAHLANLLELIAKILQREFFLAQLTFQVGGRFFVDRLLHAFDKRHDVAHAQNAGDDAFRIFLPTRRTLPARR